MKTIYDEKIKPVNKDNFVKRAHALKQEGELLYASWKDLQRNLYPLRGYFYDSKPNKGSLINHKYLIDQHATRCIRDSASGMQAGLTSSARPWFQIETPDPELNEYKPVKVQLEAITKILLFIMATSNSYDMHPSIYEELLTFGQAGALVVGDYFDVIRCRTFTCGEYFIGVDNRGEVDALYRMMWMTVGQIVKEFGIENVSATIKNAYERNRPDDWKQVNHLIEVNDDRVPFFKDYKNMMYRSIYWENSEKDKYLRKGGYEECPILAPWWHKITSQDTYGRGPGWNALGHIKMLQKQQKDKLLSIEKVANPPMQRDSSVQGEVNTLPGGLTTFSANSPNAGLKPAYQIAPDIQSIATEIENVKKDITNDFYTDLFRMIMDINRTGVSATEIAEKKAEQLSLISPFIDRLTDRYHKKFIERIFGVALRSQLFPPFPQEMKGMDLRIKYISIVAQAQKMIGLTAIENAMAFNGKLAQMNPVVMDNVNFDETYRTYVDMIGISAKSTNSKEEVVKIRVQRAKDQKITEDNQRAMALVEGAEKGANAVKAMAQAPMGKDKGDNVLTKTMKSVEEMNK